MKLLKAEYPQYAKLSVRQKLNKISMGGASEVARKLDALGGHTRDETLIIDSEFDRGVFVLHAGSLIRVNLRTKDEARVEANRKAGRWYDARFVRGRWRN